MKVYQSKRAFFVCIRPRDELGSDASSFLEARWPVGGTGAYEGIFDAYDGYCKAVDHYGPDYRVVIEPVESNHPFTSEEGRFFNNPVWAALERVRQAAEEE